jgi:hypothetical protein
LEQFTDWQTRIGGGSIEPVRAPFLTNQVRKIIGSLPGITPSELVTAALDIEEKWLEVTYYFQNHHIKSLYYSFCTMYT